MVLCLVIPLGLLVWVLVAVVDVTASETKTVLDDAGVTGTATVVSCEAYTVGSGRSRRTNYDCEARFVFDDRSREPVVIDTVPEVEVGEVFPAVLTPEGTGCCPRGRGACGGRSCRSVRYRSRSPSSRSSPRS
nr:hypothetical protein GCM10020093_078600 [Planobispora longispora]